MLSLLFAMATATAFAQSEIQVPDITVLGAPAASPRQTPVAKELSGLRLQRKKKSTLGETLAHETGVTSTFFGPNASRPVLRGLEGDRVRILQNGTGVLDASSASQDHAVASDTLNLERIEIVRGPAALLYGSNAVGGTVNLITSRIPERRPEQWRGKFETRYNSTDDGRAGALSLELPAGEHWAVHVDGSQRAADDYHVPGYARTDEARATEPASENEARGRAYNSFNRTGEYSVGTSRLFEKGFLGASLTNYDSSYGTVAERFVHINMLQQRFDLAGEARELGFFRSVRFKNSFSRYKHDEIEDGSLGTTFKNDGDEWRVEGRHNEIQGFAGTLGVQGGLVNSSVKGDEAFLPTTENQNYSLFLFEETAEGRFKPSFGLRGDWNQVTSEAGALFGPGQTKTFAGGSAALGFAYQLSSPWSLNLNLAYTQRAPNAEELFANGPHVATHTFEMGDRGLNPEQSRSAELSLRHKTDEGQGVASAFVQDIHDFIAQSPTGAADVTSGLPIYAYRAVEARLLGAEFEYKHKLFGQFELEGKLDFVRGLNRSTGDNLPRMTPLRETLSLLYRANRYQADIELERSESQHQTAPFETRTEAYNLLNAGVEVPLNLRMLSLSLVARVSNILDQEARNHVSVIKDLAPLPGRSYSAALQASF